MGSDEQVPWSVLVLREAGETLDVREITKRTTNRAELKGVRFYYEDVYYVLKSAEKRGLVKCVEDEGDFGSTKWEAQ